MNDITGIIVAIAIVFILVIIIVKGIKSIKKKSFKKEYSEQEVAQAYVNAKAQERPVGPGSGLKKHKGWKWVILFIIALIMVYLLIFSELPQQLFK